MTMIGAKIEINNTRGVVLTDPLDTRDGMVVVVGLPGGDSARVPSAAIAAAIDRGLPVRKVTEEEALEGQCIGTDAYLVDVVDREPPGEFGAVGYL